MGNINEKLVFQQPDVPEQAAAARQTLQVGICVETLITKEIVHQHFPFLAPVSRTTTTVLKAATPACCATATLSARSPERVTERAASVSVNPESSDASATAVTTPSLRSLLTAAKVRTCHIIKSLQCLIYDACFIMVTNTLNNFLFLSSSSPSVSLLSLLLHLSVIYDSCPQAIEAGIWWPRTKFGLPAAVPCPKGTLGMMVFQAAHLITI